MIDASFRNRDYEGATPFGYVKQLVHDLIFQVPRENEDQIWLGLADSVRPEYRDVGPRGGVSVGGVVDKVRDYAAVV